MAEPLIFTKNFVNADDVFTVSHGSGAIGNIYNRDKDSLWMSDGADDDATEATIEVAFYEGLTAISRTIDRLILVNHNLADFEVFYWDGSQYVSWLNVTGETLATSVKTLSEQTTTKVKIVMTVTQTADQEKYIAEMVFCALQLDIDLDMQKYDVTFREKAKTLQLGDGSLARVLIYWSPRRTEKYEAKVNFSMLPLATFDSMAEIKERGLPFLWYPESEAQPDQIFLVHWTNPLKWKYSSPYKSAGIDLDMDLKEV